MDLLLEKFCPDMKALQQRVVHEAEGVAPKVRAYITVVRFCVISFIVSCAARPRDGSGQIVKDALPMRHLISDELLDFMQVVFGTDDFAALEATVRLGMFAHASASAQTDSARPSARFAEGTTPESRAPHQSSRGFHSVGEPRDFWL